MDPESQALLSSVLADWEDRFAAAPDEEGRQAQTAVVAQVESAFLLRTITSRGQLPNDLCTAAAAECLDKLVAELPRYTAVLSMIREVLLAAVYSDWEGDAPAAVASDSPWSLRSRMASPPPRVGEPRYAELVPWFAKARGLSDNSALLRRRLAAAEDRLHLLQPKDGGAAAALLRLFELVSARERPSALAELCAVTDLTGAQLAALADSADLEEQQSLALVLLRRLVGAGASLWLFDSVLAAMAPDQRARLLLQLQTHMDVDERRAFQLNMVRTLGVAERAEVLGEFVRQNAGLMLGLLSRENRLHLLSLVDPDDLDDMLAELHETAEQERAASVASVHSRRASRAESVGLPDAGSDYGEEDDDGDGEDGEDEEEEEEEEDDDDDEQRQQQTEGGLLAAPVVHAAETPPGGERRGSRAQRGYASAVGRRARSLCASDQVQRVIASYLQLPEADQAKVAEMVAASPGGHRAFPLPGASAAGRTTAARRPGRNVAVQTNTAYMVEGTGLGAGSGLAVVGPAAARAASSAEGEEEEDDEDDDDDDDDDEEEEDEDEDEEEEAPKRKPKYIPSRKLSVTSLLKRERKRWTAMSAVKKQRLLRPAAAMELVAGIYEAKALADSADHRAQPQPMSSFVRDHLILKYGLKHIALTMLRRLAWTTTQLAPSNLRLRSFAVNVGIKFCCAGRECECPEQFDPRRADFFVGALRAIFPNHKAISEHFATGVALQELQDATTRLMPHLSRGTSQLRDRLSRIAKPGSPPRCDLDVALEILCDAWPEEEKLAEAFTRARCVRVIQSFYRGYASRKAVAPVIDRIRASEEAAALHTLFERFDNGDGVVDFAEFRAILGEIDPAVTVREALELFNACLDRSHVTVSLSKLAVAVSLARGGGGAVGGVTDEEDEDEDEDDDEVADDDHELAGQHVPTITTDVFIAVVRGVGYHLDNRHRWTRPLVLDVNTIPPVNPMRSLIESLSLKRPGVPDPDPDPASDSGGDTDEDEWV